MDCREEGNALPPALRIEMRVAGGTKSRFDRGYTVKVKDQRSVSRREKRAWSKISDPGGRLYYSCSFVGGWAHRLTTIGVLSGS